MRSGVRLAVLVLAAFAGGACAGSGDAAAPDHSPVEGERTALILGVERLRLGGDARTDALAAGDELLVGATTRTLQKAHVGLRSMIATFECPPEEREWFEREVVAVMEAVERKHADVLRR